MVQKTKFLKTASTKSFYPWTLLSAVKLHIKVWREKPPKGQRFKLGYQKKVTYSVESECSVSKEPGATVVIWLSYSDSRRTELSPVKLSFPTQLTLLLLSILRKKNQHFSAQPGQAPGLKRLLEWGPRATTGLLPVKGHQSSDPGLPVTSLERLSAVCVEQAGRQGWLGGFHRGKGCFTESQNG